MGIVLCKKHGRNGMVLTCPHLSDSVWGFKEIPDFVKRVDKDNSEIEDEWRIDFEYMLCNFCNKEYSNIPIYKFPDHFIRGSCAKCFKELSNY